jgi:hypothetical protein
MLCIKANVHELVDKHMDTTKSLYSPAQNTEVLSKVICPEIIKTCPRLDEYQNCWPVVDIARVYLKNTASRARSVDQKAQVAAVTVKKNDARQRSLRPRGRKL